MASNLNQVCIEGNLTRDPVMRSTPRGMAVSNFSIASNRYYKDKQSDALEKEVSFFDVQCWGRLAEDVYNECVKGTPVKVTGRLKQDRWTDKEGNNVSKIIIVADNVNKQERQPRQEHPQEEGCPF